MTPLENIRNIGISAHFTGIQTQGHGKQLLKEKKVETAPAAAKAPAPAPAAVPATDLK